MPHKFSIVYFLVLIAALLSLEWRWTEPLFHLISKCLLMTTLLVGTIATLKPKPWSAGFLLAIGLFLALLGDYFMIDQDQDTMFMLGLGAFLLAHLGYIFTFAKARYANFEILATKKLPLFIFLFIGVSVVIFLKLKSELGNMELPVLIYVLVITVMAIGALNRYGKTPLSSFWLVFFGAVLFMASDTIIAFDRFLDPIPFAPYLILSVYAIAQWMIVKGVIDHEMLDSEEAS